MSTSMKQLLSILAITLALSGCASDGDSQPKDPNGWITSPPQKQGFRYGVGSAKVIVSTDKAAKRARESALADIAQQIEVTVSGTTSSYQQESVQNEQSELMANYSVAIQTRIPEFKFRHFKQINSYHDQADNQVYILVELDLNKELADLKTQISRLDQTISENELSVDASTGFSGLQESARQLQRLAERKTLQARYNRLSSTTHPLLNAFQEEQQIRLMNRLISTPIGIVSIRLEAKPLVEQLVALLTEKGIAVSTTDHELIFIEVDLTESSKEDKSIYYHFVDGRYRIVNEIGTILDEKSATAKGSSSTQNMAKSRAIRKLADQLASGLISAIMGE